MYRNSTNCQIFQLQQAKYSIMTTYEQLNIYVDGLINACNNTEGGTIQTPYGSKKAHGFYNGQSLFGQGFNIILSGLHPTNGDNRELS